MAVLSRPNTTPLVFGQRRKHKHFHAAIPLHPGARVGRSLCGLFMGVSEQPYYDRWPAHFWDCTRCYRIAIKRRLVVA